MPGTLPQRCMNARVSTQTPAQGAKCGPRCAWLAPAVDRDRAVAGSSQTRRAQTRLAGRLRHRARALGPPLSDRHTCGAVGSPTLHLLPAMLTLFTQSGYTVVLTTVCTLTKGSVSKAK